MKGILLCKKGHFGGIFTSEALKTNIYLKNNSVSGTFYKTLQPPVATISDQQCINDMGEQQPQDSSLPHRDERMDLDSGFFLIIYVCVSSLCSTPNVLHN